MMIINWIKDRSFERASWDGAALIAVGLLMYFLGPYTEYVALAAVVWGVITFLKPEA